jgi:hypothetical protein
MCGIKGDCSRSFERLIFVKRSRVELARDNLLLISSLKGRAMADVMLRNTLVRAVQINQTVQMP